VGVAAPSPDKAPEATRTPPASRQSAAAPTRYITDQVVVLLRSGPSNKHKIIQNLRSGAKLKLLESNNDFARVRTENGTEGWVLKRYLTDSPIAEHRLDEADKTIAALKKDKQKLQEQLQQLNETFAKLKANHREMDKEKTHLESEMAEMRKVAAEPLAISNANRTLMEQSAELENQVQELQDKLLAVQDDSTKQWFLTGAAVVLLGIFIGLTIPKLRRHRRRSDDWSNLK
jgi:SH3 domain protein